jgi:hypothetical protein
VGFLFGDLIPAIYGDLSGDLSLGLDRPVDRQDIIPIRTLWLWDADLDRLKLI